MELPAAQLEIEIALAVANCGRILREPERLER
jgi:hypothetical protein